MAGSRRGGATGAFTVTGKFKPVPEYALTFVRDYDIKGIGAMLAKAAPCSMEERIELFRKNVEQFKKPNAFGTFPNKGMSKAKDEEEEGEESEGEDDEVDADADDDVYEDDEYSEVEDDEYSEVEDDEDGEGVDEETLKLQVPNEGGRACKKPRLAEGFGCQTEAAV
ncbi:unnamed protein product [Triticum turgidum subsp. durum]|uniref:Uncharacterized protein n=1 Tax=Triticum turgidum subsp. durum TaxID=4567 RepID=A0A9R1BZK1_TRITD|nr:unnamed protein product [Triticum turgidum subsp. durum]